MAGMNPQQSVAMKKAPVDHPCLVEKVAVDGDTWLTPRWILEEIGRFDLDPCAAASNPSWVAKTAYCLPETDGLRAEWFGRVFCNPPFSDTAPWLERHAKHGVGISLVPASVESVVWRRIVWPQAKAIFLLHGRTRFCNPDGSATTGRPLRPVALIAWSEFDRMALDTAPFAGVFLSGWRQV